MDVWSSALISLLLLGFAAGSMASHVRTWRRAKRQEPEEDSFDYSRRQFRRRMQTSAMLGVLAVAIFAGQLITGPRLLLIVFWGATLLLVVWVVLLAVADMVATKFHFGRLRQTYIIEQAKLKAELRRIQALRGNGKASTRNRGAKRDGPGK